MSGKFAGRFGWSRRVAILILAVALSRRGREGSMWWWWWWWWRGVLSEISDNVFLFERENFFSGRILVSRSLVVGLGRERQQAQAQRRKLHLFRNTNEKRPRGGRPGRACRQRAQAWRGRGWRAGARAQASGIKICQLRAHAPLSPPHSRPSAPVACAPLPCPQACEPTHTTPSRRIDDSHCCAMHWNAAPRNAAQGGPAQRNARCRLRKQLAASATSAASN